ncbi:hypothetical protein QR680_007972 [Steinernema hermaphroditum]|uniref:Uncharacterized protein n=1 Tax=Steinernema hermaphroditum TaxID=289476 RepID=A0AA39IH18_9BILA|nr:hypothetical protein QR680_007972 [Steinernema hermaphroditum]
MFIASLSNMVIVIAYIIERFEYEYCGIFICGWQLIAVSYFNDHCSLLKSESRNAPFTFFCDSTAMCRKKLFVISRRNTIFWLVYSWILWIFVTSVQVTLLYLYYKPTTLFISIIACNSLFFIWALSVHVCLTVAVVTEGLTSKGHVLVGVYLFYMFTVFLFNLVTLVFYIIELSQYGYAGLFICAWQLIALNYFNGYYSYLKNSDVIH